MAQLSVDNSFAAVSQAASQSPGKAAGSESGDELNQADFIELLVAQVKNQDPTKPMDPSQFMNQLTQSSMVNGLAELQTSFNSLANKLSSGQSLQAAGLVGKSVLLPGGQGLLTNGGSIDGQIDIEQQASEVKLNIFNSYGEQVRSLPLGGHSGGQLFFKWDGFADDGSVAPAGNYLVTAEALIDGKQEAVEVSLESRIDSISLGQGDEATAGTLLNLEGGRSVTLNEVRQIS